MCNTIKCRDNKVHRSYTGFLDKIKNLEVNEYINVPIERWGSSRSLVSRLNKTFGTEIHVFKKGNFIQIIRYK